MIYLFVVVVIVLASIGAHEVGKRKGTDGERDRWMANAKETSGMPVVGGWLKVITSDRYHRLLKIESRQPRVPKVKAETTTQRDGAPV